MTLPVGERIETIADYSKTLQFEMTKSVLVKTKESENVAVIDCSMNHLQVLERCTARVLREAASQQSMV